MFLQNVFKQFKHFNNGQSHISLNIIIEKLKHKNPWNQNKLAFNPIWLVRFQIKYSKDTKETLCIILYISFLTLKTNSVFIFWILLKCSKISTLILYSIIY